MWFVSHFYNFEPFPSVKSGYIYRHCRAVVRIRYRMTGPQHGTEHVVRAVILVAFMESHVQLSPAQGSPGQISEPS